MSVTYRQSALGTELRAIVDDHPHVEAHPASPVGPYCRAVLWTALRTPLPPLKGQALLDTDVEPARWVVRAYNTFMGTDTTETTYPDSQADIPEAITDIVTRFR